MGWDDGRLDWDAENPPLRSAIDVPHNAVPAPASTGERRAVPPVNPELLEESVRMVISVASETHSNLLAEKAAGLVRIVYEHSRTTGHVDPGFVAQLVKLMR